MKKNNSYLVNDETSLADLIKSLLKEKVLILSISIICGLVAYLYASFQPLEFKTEIKLKNPPFQLFEPYGYNFNNSNNNNNNLNNNIFEKFISDFKSNFLSSDNLQSFLEERREFDNFKVYLKLRNISAKMYFKDRISEVKEKNFIVPNKYSLVFTKELDVDIFLNNYVEFIKKKTLSETKKIFQLSIKYKINNLENALEKAKLINLEDPILRSMNQANQVVNEPEDLFYKGSKIISQELIYLKKLSIKLENDQFNYNAILDTASSPKLISKPKILLMFYGILFGLIFSIIIIFFKDIIVNKS